MLSEIKQILSATPGLKGREIAKKLIGVDRKSVNSFLSKNLDTFYQDKSYCWYLREQQRYELLLPSNKWINQYDFERALQKSCDPFEPNIVEVMVKIPEKCSLMLISISRLLALLNQLALTKKQVSVDLTNCASTQSFLDRAGFFELLDESISVLPSRPTTSNSRAAKYKDGSETLVEFGEVTPNSTKDQLRSLIVQLGKRFVSHTSDTYHQVIMTVFGEMIQNVKEHSSSEISGFAALQKYSPPNSAMHIQTVISDSGKGVVDTLRETLSTNHPNLAKKYTDNGTESDIALVEHVFSKGEVSRKSEEGRGLGFKSSREHASKQSAILIIRQKHFSIELTYKSGKLIDTNVLRDLAPIQGTHLCFDFIIDSY